MMLCFIFLFAFSTCVESSSAFLRTPSSSTPFTNHQCRYLFIPGRSLENSCLLEAFICPVAEAQTEPRIPQAFRRPRETGPGPPLRYVVDSVPCPKTFAQIPCRARPPVDKISLDSKGMGQYYPVTGARVTALADEAPQST